MSNTRYEPELKEKVLRLYLEEGPTKKSLTQEYHLGQETLTYWLKQYRKEYQEKPTLPEKDVASAEIRRLRKALNEAQKEFGIR